MATNNRSRNNCQVQIAHHNDSNVDAPYKNLDPELKTFCNSWNQKFKIESQLNANYSFDNFLEGDQTG
jgi:chromosomal replication initiation ATPase DnaA